jgi:AP-4 complex subunit beta-1
MLPSESPTPGHDRQSTSNPASGYFVDQKRGEVNELKQLLKDINIERDLKRKREVIKKVIAYMTLGIDVSRLFTDMVMAIETKDIVIKKMIYQYLCRYYNKEPDMTVLCINTLCRDCSDDDPMVRGLALRSLCNLRLSTVLEYIEKYLKKGLYDISSYVRKIAVMGILKVLCRLELVHLQYLSSPPFDILCFPIRESCTIWIPR